MEIQTISLKKLSDVMTEYRPVYPEPYNWETTIAYMLKERTERIIVEELIEELKTSEQGVFREPICLYKQEIESEDMEDEFYQNILNNGYIRTENDAKTYSYTIGDGTHRVVAAYLYGADEILTTENTLNEELAYFIVSSVKAEEKEFTEDEKEVLANCSRSIKITENLWLTSSLSTQDSKGTFIYWDTYSPDIDLKLISQKIEERISSFFPHITFSVETFLEPWIEEEDESKLENEIWDDLTLNKDK